MSEFEIVRDVDGIAHVRAPTLAGAFEGQGLAAAQDRCWQLVLDRRRASGRLAAIAGPAAVASDAFHRRMDLRASAEASLAALGEEATAALQAYARFRDA